MRIWIDIENPPQVQYLAPFKARFEAHGAEVVVTSVENAITEELLAQRGIEPVMAGSKSRAGVLHKGLAGVTRAAWLARAVGRPRPRLLLAGSRAALLAARAQNITSFAVCDYEHVSLSVGRLTRSYIVHPDVIDQQAFVDRGIRRDRLVPMHGIKESLSLEGVDFEGTAPAEVPRPGGRDDLPIALVRAPGEQAHYFVEESLDLYRKLLRSLAARDDVGVLLSPRYDGQERLLDEFDWTVPPAVLRDAVPFVSLLKAVDLVVSSGGTMAREAAFLGIPSYSILRSAIGQVDLYLESLGRLTIIRSEAELPKLQVEPRAWPGLLEPLDGRRVDELASRLLQIATTRTSRARGALRRARAGS